MDWSIFMIGMNETWREGRKLCIAAFDLVRWSHNGK